MNKQFFSPWDMRASMSWLGKRRNVRSWGGAYARFRMDKVLNQPATDIKRPTKEEVELCRRIMRGPWGLKVHLRWMNLSRAVAVSEGVAIRIGIFTWDSSNCRGNVSLISHQLHLLILLFQGEDHVNFGKAENQSNCVGDLGGKYGSYLS